MLKLNSVKAKNKAGQNIQGLKKESGQHPDNNTYTFNIQLFKNIQYLKLFSKLTVVVISVNLKIA